MKVYSCQYSTQERTEPELKEYLKFFQEMPEVKKDGKKYYLMIKDDQYCIAVDYSATVTEGKWKILFK